MAFTDGVKIRRRESRHATAHFKITGFYPVVEKKNSFVIFENMIYPWQLYVFLGYGIPLFLLYIFVIIQLIFNREFNAPFFKIATVLGFVVRPESSFLGVYCSLRGFQLTDL